MKSGKLPGIFFGLAFALLVLWGAVEFILGQEGISPSANFCSTKNKFQISGRKVVSQIDSNLWLYNPKNENLENQKLTLENLVASAHVVSSVPLRCAKIPSYHCFVNLPEGMDSLNPVIIADGIGVLEARKKDRVLIVPFKLIENGVRLGSALHLCGRALNPDPELFFSSDKHLFYFDPQTSRLAQWDSSRFDGFMTQGVPKEPEVLLGIDAKNGLIPTSCDVASSIRVPAQIIQFQRHRFGVLQDEEDHTRFRVYSFSADTGLQPDFQFSENSKAIDKIWSLGGQGFIAQSAKAGLTRWQWSEDEKTYKTFPLPHAEKASLLNFASGDSDNVFMWSGSKILGRRRIWNKNQDQWRMISQNQWQVYRGQLEPLWIYQATAGQGLFIDNSKNSVELTPYDCH